MYAIGVFSKLVQVPVKTLRYYHEIGLFIPSTVDEKTGYRYYDFDKFTEIEKIKFLKSLNMTLDEIKDITQNGFDDLDYFLAEQKMKLEIEIINLKNTINRIDDLLLDKVKKNPVNFDLSSVEFEIKKDELVLCVTEEIDMKDINLLVKKLFEKSYAFNLPIMGNLMAQIHKGKEISLVTVMMKVEEDMITKDNVSETIILEGGRYACVYFRGIYSELFNAYEVLSQLVEDKKTCFYEEYIEGLLPEQLSKPLEIRADTKKHPEQFLTKVYLKV